MIYIIKQEQGQLQPRFQLNTILIGASLLSATWVCEYKVVFM